MASTLLTVEGYSVTSHVERNSVMSSLMTHCDSARLESKLPSFLLGDVSLETVYVISLRPTAGFC